MESKNLNYIYNVEYYKRISFSNSDISKLEKDKEILKENNNLIRDFSPVCEMISVCAANKFIRLQTTYPGLLIGSGYPHEYGGEGESALGFSFDYVTGMPYIPGSSVKGILRSAFKHPEYISEILNMEVNITDFENSIFGEPAERNNKDMFVNKRDIFYDAVIVGYDKGILETDNITPHRQIKELLELAEPNPITFIKVRPGVTFQFEFKLYDYQDKCVTIGSDIKLNLFKQILLDLGAGAKTNVGYGAFIAVSEDNVLNVQQTSEVSQPENNETINKPQENGICGSCGKPTKIDSRTGAPHPLCHECKNKNIKNQSKQNNRIKYK